MSEKPCRTQSQAKTPRIPAINPPAETAKFISAPALLAVIGKAAVLDFEAVLTVPPGLVVTPPPDPLVVVGVAAEVVVIPGPDVVGVLAGATTLVPPLPLLRHTVVYSDITEAERVCSGQ